MIKFVEDSILIGDTHPLSTTVVSYLAKVTTGEWARGNALTASICRRNRDSPWRDVSSVYRNHNTEHELNLIAIRSWWEINLPVVLNRLVY